MHDEKRCFERFTSAIPTRRKDLYIFGQKLLPVIESYITVILAVRLKFFRLSHLSMGLYHLVEYQLIDYHVMPYMRKKSNNLTDLEKSNFLTDLK